MNIPKLTSGLIAAALLVLTSSVSINAQDERERDSERAELRRQANQLEEKLHKWRRQREEVVAALERMSRKEQPDRYERLVAQRKELEAGIAQITEQFAEMRKKRERQRDETEERRHGVNELEARIGNLMEQRQELNAALERMGKDHPEKREEMMSRRKRVENAIAELKHAFEKGKQPSERDELRDSELQQHANQIEKRMNRIREQRKEINQALQRLNRKEHPDRHEELMAQRKGFEAALNEFEHVFARVSERRGNREREGRRERDSDRPEHRQAQNRLEHMHTAYGHLREAGMNEIAQVVEERIAKLEQELRVDERQREEEHREGDRARENEVFQREISGAVRELNAAVRQLREEVKQLKRNR